MRNSSTPATSTARQNDDMSYDPDRLESNTGLPRKLWSLTPTLAALLETCMARMTRSIWGAVTTAQAMWSLSAFYDASCFLMRKVTDDDCNDDTMRELRAVTP